MFADVENGGVVETVETVVTPAASEKKTTAAKKTAAPKKASKATADEGQYAVIATGGKQYKVKVGEIIKIEKLFDEKGALVESGSKVTFKPLMVVKGDNVEVGKAADKSVVEAEVVDLIKGPKVIVYKYKAKKNYRRKKGHRQSYTRVKITAIG